MSIPYSNKTIKRKEMLNAVVQIKNEELKNKLLKEKYKLDYRRNGEYYFIATPELIEYLKEFKKR